MNGPYTKEDPLATLNRQRQTTGRPLISLIVDSQSPLVGAFSGQIKMRVVHNGDKCRVVLRKDLISVGCTDITPEDAKYILKEWEAKFGEKQVEVYEL